MAKIRQPTSEHRRSIEDSLRWRDFLAYPNRLEPQPGATKVVLEP